MLHTNQSQFSRELPSIGNPRQCPPFKKKNIWSQLLGITENQWKPQKNPHKRGKPMEIKRKAKQNKQNQRKAKGTASKTKKTRTSGGVPYILSWGRVCNPQPHIIYIFLFFKIFYFSDFVSKICLFFYDIFDFSYFLNIFIFWAPMRPIFTFFLFLRG